MKRYTRLRKRSKKYFNYSKMEEGLLKSYEEISGDTRYKENPRLRELKLQQLKGLNEMWQIEGEKPSLIGLLKNAKIHKVKKEK